MKEEIWKVIEDYPNYEVSSLGRVRNIETGRILKPGTNSCGYRFVILSFEGRRKLLTIHRLVATAFIPNLDCKREVNHVNRDKTDNRVENLEWNTHSENMCHTYRTGLKESPPKQRVRCIETGQIFESQSQASRYFGCCYGSIWASVNKGYKVLEKYHLESV